MPSLRISYWLLELLEDFIARVGSCLMRSLGGVLCEVIGMR